MSVLDRFVTSLVFGMAGAVADRALPRRAEHPAVGWCRLLGWAVDEWLGEGVLALHFNDPVTRVRKVFVTANDNNTLVVVKALSAVEWRPAQVPSELAAQLLSRNAETAFTAWQMANTGRGTVIFGVGCGLFADASPAQFRAVCETVCEEVRVLDTRLRAGGLI